MKTDLTVTLATLAEPAAPDTMTATVMARIAREAETMEQAVATAPRRDSPAWWLALVGAAAAGAVFALAWFTSGLSPDYLSSRVGRPGPALAPVQGPFAALMALSLFLYVVGLFAPIRARRRE